MVEQFIAEGKELVTHEKPNQTYEKMPQITK